jgi:putative ABC transport system permease protein
VTPQFPRIFAWHVLRRLARHPGLGLLNVLSVALGITVYVAIQLANHSANRSFAAGIDLVAGKAQLEVRGDVDETFWPILAKQPGVRAATGQVEGVVTLPDTPGEYLRILGVDIFTGDPFRTFRVAAGLASPPLESWIGQPGAVAITQDFARRLDLNIGDKLRVLANGVVKDLAVVAFLDDPDNGAPLPERFAVMDIGWAQELLSRQGFLSSIQLLLDDPGKAQSVAARLNAVLPPHLRVEAPRQRSFQIQNMLSAFQLNLTALSMVSLLVGVFLIYNTISASVARRRVEIGILRSIGATRAEVRCLFLGEACFFGILGIAFGAFGGIILARALAGAVAKTISSHYVLLSIDRNWLSPGQFVAASIYGVIAVLAGAWLPAGEASRIDPVQALSPGGYAERSIARRRRWGIFGIALLAVAGLASWLALTVGPPAWGFVAAFCILAGFAFFAPDATAGFGALAAIPTSPGILWRLAADNLRRSIHRNAVTVAALAAAIAMMTGLTVMIYSFRQSVDTWIHRGIVADLYIAPASNETVGLGASTPPAAIAWLKARPEVRGVDTFRELTVPISLRDRPSQSALLAVIGGEYRHNLTFRRGDDVQIMARVNRGGAIAITEPFARRYGVKDGDHLTLITPRGPAIFEIAGTYSDYTRDQGVILIAQKTFEKFWQEASVQSLSVYLKPGAAWEPLAGAFRARFSRQGEYTIYSNRSLRDRILSIFDQTFAVTYILRTVAVLVAITGVFLAVTTLAAEREREIGVLRSIGASRAQVRRALVIEAGMMGVVASALGLAAGIVLAMALTWVVNPAFFGWTITLQLPGLTLLATPFWIIPVALIAAWFPAWRASRSEIAQTIREE